MAQKKVETDQETKKVPSSDEIPSEGGEEKKETEVEQSTEEKTEETVAEQPEAEAPEAKQEVEEKAEAMPAGRQEPKVDTPKAEEKPTPKAAPSGKHAELIKEIESMTVADLADLVKALEDRFGVSAAAPVAAVAGAQAAAGAPEQAEEKSSYTVVLKDGGAQKIAAIKAVREINQDLGLKEAKDLVEGAPKEVKKDVPKAEAEEAKKKLEAAGATVELV